ncbi:MAG: outer membrane lipoprotein carrier protein LolA [Deltaproteobacteria bacterium]|nr:outer membrane lipoprotein carrier protein LolA [Deltaproteobacteria bacterium]
MAEVNLLRRIIFCSVLGLFFLNSSFVLAGVAKAVESRYNQLKTWQAQFEQRTFVEMVKQEMIKSGQIQVLRPNRLKVSYQSVPQKTYLSDGKNVYVFKQDDDVAYVFGQAKKIISPEALSFLGGLQNLSDHFEIFEDLKQPEGSYQIKDKNLKILTLLPKSKDASLLRITLGVDAKEHLVREAVLFTASGNVSYYRFSDTKIDTPLSDSLFTVPKGKKLRKMK